MKNFIFYVFVTTFFCLYAAEYSKAWREKFKSINHSALKKQLGYDPALELIEDNNAKVIHSSGPTLYVHGWLGSKDAHYLRRRCNDSYKMPGDIIVFNFEDASCWFTMNIGKNTISFPYWMPINKSNFAQERDVKTLLCILSELYKCNILIPVCYAHSRGAAVITKVVGILNNPQEWHNKLTELSITDEMRKNIIQSTKIVYLNTPLKRVSLAIKRRCENRLFFFTYVFPFLQAFVSNNVSSSIQQSVLPLCSSYDPKDTKEPIEYLKDWNNLITAVLHFQYNDTHVPNDDDAECAQNLLKANPDNTYVIMGKDGGHNYGDRTIAKVIHALNKEKKCSYYNDQKIIEDGVEILKNHKHSWENVEKYINDKNAEFQKEECSENSFTSLSIKNIVLYTSIVATAGILAYKTYKKTLPNFR